MKHTVVLLICLSCINAFARETFQSRLNCKLYHNQANGIEHLLYPLERHKPEPYSITNNPVTMYPHQLPELYEADFSFRLDNSLCRIYFGTARLIHPKKRNRQKIANKYSFIGFDTSKNRLFATCQVDQTMIGGQRYYSIKIKPQHEIKFILDEMINIGFTKIRK